MPTVIAQHPLSGGNIGISYSAKAKLASMYDVNCFTDYEKY